MSIIDFDKRFGITRSIEEEKIQFVNRIENSIFDSLINLEFHEYEKVFEGVCYELGLNSSDIINENSGLRRKIPNLGVISAKDFLATLRVVVAVYNSFSDKPKAQQIIGNYVLSALDKSAINIGLKWVDGTFYPTGDELLDKELIDTAVTLLDNYPNEKIDLKTALENYQAKSLFGVVENCYLCIEGICRKILNNKRTLDHNQTELLKLLQFSNYWDKIFLNYLKYAHEIQKTCWRKSSST